VGRWVQPAAPESEGRRLGCSSPPPKTEGRWLGCCSLPLKLRRGGWGADRCHPKLRGGGWRAARCHPKLKATLRGAQERNRQATLPPSLSSPDDDVSSALRWGGLPGDGGGMEPHQSVDLQHFFHSGFRSAVSVGPWDQPAHGHGAGVQLGRA